MEEDKKNKFELEGKFLIFLNKQFENIGSSNDYIPEENL